MRESISPDMRSLDTMRYEDVGEKLFSALILLGGHSVDRLTVIALQKNIQIGTPGSVDTLKAAGFIDHLTGNRDHSFIRTRWSLPSGCVCRLCFAEKVSQVKSIWAGPNEPR